MVLAFDADCNSSIISVEGSRRQSTADQLEVYACHVINSDQIRLTADAFWSLMAISGRQDSSKVSGFRVYRVKSLRSWRGMCLRVFRVSYGIYRSVTECFESVAEASCV